MVSGLAVTVENRSTGERTAFLFDRLPVLVGRDQTVVGVPLKDASVSKVHAALDYRDHSVWVRDANSTNGTLVNGEPIVANRWTRLTTSSIDIVTFRLHVRVDDNVALRAITENGVELTAVASDPLTSQRNAGPILSSGEYRKSVGDEVATAIQHWQEARNLAATTLEASFGALKGQQRHERALAVLAKNPQLAEDLLLEGKLRTALGDRPRTAATVQRDTTAYVAIHELATWYLGEGEVPTDAATIRAFKEKLRAALDELLLGYVPLVASLANLTRELAIDTGQYNAQPAPTNVSAFARLLLDWKEPSTENAKAIRQNFADLSVHQVAMLNAVMRGVKALLLELSPATIEDGVDGAQKRGLLGRTFVNRERELWEAFKVRYKDLADEEQERFRILFGREFANEYRQFSRESTVPHDPGKTH
jgi:predicted component of type VI protein secretion system